MPPTYTITADDVASVAPGSSLTAGVAFDFGNQKITVPSSVPQTSAQWVVDHARFVEESLLGVARPRIVVAGGKTQLSIDPETGLPIATAPVAILQDGWSIVTAKSSGSFIVRDVFKPDGSVPYDSVVGVFIQYLTSIGATVVSVDSGGGGGYTTADRTRDNQIAADAAAAKTNTTDIPSLIEDVSGKRFTQKALEQSPVSTGGGSSAADIYTYFTANSRADAFKANIQPALDAIAALPQDKEGYSLSTGGVDTIAMAVDAAIANDFATLLNALNGLLDEVEGLPTNAVELDSPAWLTLTNRLGELYIRQGLAAGIAATVLDAAPGTPGYLTTSNGEIAQVLTKNPDGSVTISRS